MPELISSSYSKASFPALLTFRFGMSKADAKTTYKKKGLKPIFEGSDRLDFIGPPVDVPAAAETNLLFKRNALIEISQYFEVSDDDRSAFKHIAKYRDLKDQLTAQYGPPESIEFMDDESNTSDGRLGGFKTKKGNYASMWHGLKEMNVFLVLGGDHLTTFIRVTYKAKSGA